MAGVLIAIRNYWDHHFMQSLTQRGISSEGIETECSTRLVADSDGKFTFLTNTPYSYGPPPHVNVRIIAEGYQTLQTRLVSEAIQTLARDI